MKVEWKDRYGSMFICGDYRLVKRKYFDAITESSTEVWVTYYREHAISIADTLDTAKLHARIDMDDHCEIVDTPTKAYKVAELVGEDAEGKTIFHRCILKLTIPKGARIYKSGERFKTDMISDVELLATINPISEELSNLRFCTVEDFERYIPNEEPEEDEEGIEIPKFVPTYYKIGSSTPQKVAFADTPRIGRYEDFSCTTFFPDTLSGIDPTFYGSRELPE